jgi:acylpyruvate hydrolase
MAATFARTGRKIVAIGRNYAEHAKELGNAIPKEPFFFLKPTSSYIFSGGKVEIPRGTEVHHEVELGVVIGKGGRDISQAEAGDHVAGYALAIDLTARNMQQDVRKKGLPWSACKGFDTFTPISQFIPKAEIPDPSNVLLQLKVNEKITQNGTTADMIFKIPHLIEHVSSIMTLEEGDLILTGTPSGVGPIQPGDVMTATLSIPESSTPLATLEFDVIQREKGYNFSP